MHNALSEFDAAFSARAAAEAARQDAISGAIVEDTLHPARRDEDRMARLMRRAADGVYDGQSAAYGFAAERAAAEITLANGGFGPCGTPDEFGRCSSRYHQLDCAHGVGVDWQASGPPASTGEAALANLADRLDLDLTPRAVWGDPDDPDEPGWEIPARTVELAHSLAHDWGLDATAPGFPGSTTFTDLLRPPGAPVSIEDELLAGMGYDMPQPEQPSYPGIRELAQRLGLR